MTVHRYNPILEHQLSPEQWRLNMENPTIRAGVTKQLREAPVCHDPIIGKYRQLRWSLGFDASKEIMVTADGYYPTQSGLYHSHDFFELIYVYSGHCRTQVSGKQTDLSAGDLCLYNLYAVHRVDFFQSGDGIFNIVIRKDLFRRLLLELLSESNLVSSFFLHILYDQKSTDSCIYLRPEDGYQCELLAQRLIELFFAGSSMQQITMKAQTILLLTEIARQYRDLCRTTSAAVSSLNIEAVITYISDHCLNPSLEDTARHFGYSSRSLTRYLKKHTGHSFREIVQDVRFSRARAMLQDSLLPIDEIAAAVGYRDRSNFENAFKKYCHITPSSYRRQFSST